MQERQAQSNPAFSMKPRSPVPWALQLTPWHCVCLLPAPPTSAAMRGTSKTFLAYANMTNSLSGPGPASGAVWTQVYLQRGAKGMIGDLFQDKAVPMVHSPRKLSDRPEVSILFTWHKGTSALYSVSCAPS